jgi:hypothetical protein
MSNYNNLKKILINSKNILLLLKNNNIIKLINELNIQNSYIDKIEINNVKKQYDIIFSDLINIEFNNLIKITKRYLILLNTQNNNDIKLFMELNDDWIYENNNWTWENKITIIKKRENNEKNIICIIKENSCFSNPKSFELYNYYFYNNYKIVNKNINNIINFINDKNKKDNVILFIYDIILNEFDLLVMNFIQNKNNKFYCNFFILTQDWWNTSHKSNKYFNNIITNIFKSNNYKIFVQVNDIELLMDFNGQNYSNFKDNIICYNYWGIYKNSIIEFNNNPISKILISGNLSTNKYPERFFLSNLDNKNIYVYNYNNNDVLSINNNYSKELNKYLCCFSSSVYVRNRKYKKIMNTHTILLKNYEILASGSLLLVPNYEEIYLKKIGLIQGEHYLSLNFNYNNNDMNKQINDLFNKDNLEKINKIRYNGYIYSINNLTNKQRFEELNKIFIQS